MRDEDASVIVHWVNVESRHAVTLVVHLVRDEDRDAIEQGVAGCEGGAMVAVLDDPGCHVEQRPTDGERENALQWLSDTQLSTLTDVPGTLDLDALLTIAEAPMLAI